MAFASRFTPETASAVVQAKRNGANDREAAMLAGIGHASLYRWLAAGERGEPMFVDFARAFHEAEKQYRDERIRDRAKRIEDALKSFRTPAAA